MATLENESVQTDHVGRLIVRNAEPTPETLGICTNPRKSPEVPSERSRIVAVY